ncbi:hypothetical protein PSTG_05045 [Puccinia striiformis f. sp. tritici PST-78]|uniref:No apical meristem-associated C-terminal domain-containing protein n=1 Tax=Puccinia striiformis f. sp. tritici PST-78 TaxID=1165861 RepID=A0A0L0VQR7_9BASI|nr:hypothetical protein PSTG_05045 [Puccinia striiformis f. sp. tritici PST-78]
MRAHRYPLMTRQTNDSLKFALSVAKSGDTQRALVTHVKPIRRGIPHLGDLTPLGHRLDQPIPEKTHFTFGFKSINGSQKELKEATIQQLKKSLLAVGLKSQPIQSSTPGKKKMPFGNQSQTPSTITRSMLTFVWFLSRWDVICTSTLKFLAIYNKIEKSPPSGVVEANYLKLAKEKYYNKNHHLFKMDLAWEVVCHHDRWKNHTGTTPKRKATQPPATSTTTGTN